MHLELFDNGGSVNWHSQEKRFQYFCLGLNKTLVNVNDSFKTWMYISVWVDSFCHQLVIITTFGPIIKVNNCDVMCISLCAYTCIKSTINNIIIISNIFNHTWHKCKLDINNMFTYFMPVIIYFFINFWPVTFPHKYTTDNTFSQGETWHHNGIPILTHKRHCLDQLMEALSTDIGWHLFIKKTKVFK